MHELSIATQIVETAAGAVADEPGLVVQAVVVRIGSMSNVVPEALRYAWNAATQGTRLDGARLEIEWVQAAVWCEACQKEVELPGFKMVCPECGRPTPTLVRGRELDILSLEVDDEATDAGSPDQDPQAERRAGEGAA